jgi:hypothetical protein
VMTNWIFVLEDEPQKLTDKRLKSIQNQWSLHRAKIKMYNIYMTIFHIKFLNLLYD